nr:non-ribosomal peptide synthetase [Cohnella sp. WQ 127256]
MIDKYALNMLSASGEFEEEQRYWLQQLKGDLTPVTFPYDVAAPAPDQRERASITRSYALPQELSERLYVFCNHSDYGVYMTVLSAFPFLLHLYAQADEIVIGSPVFRGEASEADRMNEILPLRISYDGQSSFKATLSDIKRKVTEANDHEFFPLRQWVEELTRVVVLFDRIHKAGFADGYCPDMTFALAKREQTLHVEVDFRADSYEQPTIDAIFRRLTRYLQVVLDEPNVMMADIDLVESEEKRRLVYDFNDTHAVYDENATIHRIFERQALKTPDRIAIVDGSEQWTYRELDEKANNLAHVLRGKGVIPNQCVGVMTERSTGMILSMLAILKAGGAYVPIDPAYPADRIAYMLENSGVRLLVHDFSDPKGLQELSCDTIDLSLVPTVSFDPLPDVNTSDDLAYVIYTSGTTGKPKGVMIEHRNVVRLFFHDKPLFQFEENDVWTMFHSYCFDFSVWEMYGALLYGGKLVVIRKEVAQDPLRFVETMILENVTVLNQTPSSFYHIIQHDLEREQPELRLRYVIFGGEALKPAILKPFKERYADTKLINMYGITETTVHVTFKEITDAEIATNVSNIGKPIPTLRCYILDDRLNLVPQGVVGELYVGGEGVARGYIHNENLTGEKFLYDPFLPKERLYRSGDLARWTDEGELEYFGRIDHQVKIRGHRIELGEIETKLLQQEEIQECLVIARKDVAGQFDLVAYYVAEQEMDVSSLRDHLATELPDFMIPAFFKHLLALPLTDNGKVDRKALPQPELARASGHVYVAPRTPTEHEIADLWADVLQLEEIGIHDNFFSIGGDSIKVIRFLSRMNKAQGSNLSVADFYRNPTIAELGVLLSMPASEGGDERERGLHLIDGMKSRLQNELADVPMPADAEDYYPLSSIQMSMVFYSKLKPDEPIYHDQFYYVLDFARFDWELLRETVFRLAVKHPILRTSMQLERYSEPIQIVHRDRMPAMALENLSACAIEEQEQRIQDYMAEDLRNKFRFDDDLLWRLGVFQLSPGEVCIVLSFHHAILDGWSVASFNKEIIDTYERLLHGGVVSAEPLKASYKDYVGIQLSRNSSLETEQFWKRELEGYTRNKLPFNLGAKQIENRPESAIYRSEIDQELLVALDRLTRDQGFTLKEICFSAYLYLMSVITTEQDLVTGIVTHDRPAIEDGENMLGCFLNTLPFREAIDRTRTGLSFMGQVQQRLRQVATHDMPLVDIANLLGEGRQHAANPLFDALFNFTDFHVLDNMDRQNEIKGSDRRLNLKSSEMTNTLFDLEVTRTWNRLGVQIKYARNYFYETEIETAFNMYLRILRNFAADPVATLREIPLMEAEQRERIVYGFNSTQTPYAREKTMHRLFEEQAARSPSRVALTMEGAELTYAELNSKANQVAVMLAERGVRPRDRVALIADRGFEMVIGMFGILKAGAAYVPIDPEYPEARQRYICENAEVTALLADRDDGLGIGNTLKLDPEYYGQWSDEESGIYAEPTDLAYIIYTSGSTGNPKGVMIEHHSAVNLIQWVNKRFEVGENDTLLFITSMCFDLSVYDLFGMLACGGKVVIARKDQISDHTEMIRLLKQDRITFWDSVPSTMNHLVSMLGQDEPDFTQTDLRLVFMSGDWIPVTLPKRIERFFPNASAIALGGATEATVWSNYYPIGAVEDTQSSIPYGVPMDNNYFYILDEELNPVPYGVAGELYIGGVGVARGYMNDPGKTMNAFLPNPFLPEPGERMYKTGDLGRMLPSGVMEFLGRKDHQVKIRGFRVELGEIESQLVKLKHVREAVVVDRPDKEGIPHLCAYVAFDQVMTSQQLRDELASKLPGYMIPSIFIPLERLPLTANGKIDRKALPEPDDSFYTGSEYEGPRDPVEERLTRIWQEVLGKERIGIRDHFFEIGGHSLLATSLALKMNREFGIDIPLLVIFNHPTVLEIADIVRSAKRSIHRRIERAPEMDEYPLSSAQQRMFILNRIEGEGLHYNSPAAFVVEGNLDAARLEEAFRSLLSRHEILRTSFALKDGVMVQRIHADLEWSVERIKLDVEASAETEVLDVIRTFVRSFDLANAPLLRVGLAQWGANRHLLLFDMHHMISDGVSMGILIREFIAYYEQQQLEAPRIQYRDYAAWQQQALNGEAMAEQRNYWLNRFADEIPVLQIATDYQRPAVKSFEGDRLSSSADKELAEGLQRVAASSGGTLYMVLLAAYNVLLAKYSGQTDIVVGSPIAGRSHADLESMLGVFINTLAMRNSPEPDKTFEQLLLEVKENALQAYANQDYPFEQLVEKLNLRNDISRNPLFDTMFILQNTDRMRYELDGLTFAEQSLEHQAVKFDLTLQVMEDSNGIRFDWEYGTKLFKKATVDRLSGHWLQLLRSIALNPSQRLADIEMISEEEKRQILKTFNNTAASYPEHTTLHETFEEQAARTPDRVAVVFEDRQMTYHELNARSNQLARHLRERGVRADMVVGVMADRSFEMIVGIYAILKAGGAYVPLDPAYPEERLLYMLRDSGIELVLTQSDTALSLPVSTILLTDSRLYAGEDSNLPSISGPTHLAYVIYTSGSTGKPKGVMIEHRSVMNRLNWMQKQYPLTGDDVLLQKTRYSFDVSVWEMFWWFMAGARLSVLSPEVEMDPNRLAETIERDGVTVIHFVPSMLNAFLDYAEQSDTVANRTSSLRWVVCSGEALPLASVQRFNRVLGRPHSIRLANLYGPTEATVDVTYYDCSPNDDDTMIPIGRPIDNTSVFVVDPLGRLQPIGVIGELCIAGVGLARGYAGELGRTQDRFVDHPYVSGERMYKTGDLARWLPDGLIEYRGRLDHQVKIRGFRIELGEIEAQLSKYPSILEAAVIDRTDAQQSRYLCAYYASNEEITVSELRAYLLSKLPDYMIPSYFVRLDRMPLTANGKLDRRRLPEPVERIHTGTPYVAPRDTIERQLAEIWQQLLGIESVGLQDHFFDLGGHSLKAMVLVSRIQKEFGVEAQVREVFQHPFLEELAECIRLKEIRGYDAIPNAEIREYYPMSAAQRRMFILNQMEGKGVQYNNPNAFLLAGALDEQRLAEAFRQLLVRHDTLRTSFVMENELPVQRIDSDAAISIERYEMNRSETSERSSLEDIIRRFVRPFDLHVAPLLRIGLAKIAEDRHLLLFDMHHIISDGVSMGIFVREFIALYEGKELPALRIQYKDFATWQQEAAYQDALLDDETYWLNRFAGELPVLDLPSDDRRPAVFSYEGDRIQFSANREMTEGLHQVAARTGSSMYMVLLAAYNVLLAKVTGQTDIVVGSPIAGRSHADLEGMLGVFINTLAMRNAPEPDKTFEQLLLEVKENALQAYAHQDYPFEQLVDKLNLRKDLSRNPLFDTMFILQNMDQEQLEIPGLTLTPYPFDLRTSKYDLTLQASEEADVLSFTMEFGTKLFKKETIERLATHWLRILQYILLDPSLRLADIDILPEEERRLIVHEFNDTTIDYAKDKTLHHMFEEQAAARPDEVAIVFEHERLTYGELDERSNRLAHTLRERGVTQDTVVGLMAERSLEMFIGIYGILKAGASYLPMDPAYPQERLDYMLLDSGAKLVLSHTSQSVPVSVETMQLADPNLYSDNKAALPTIAGPLNLAYVIYTSGSTGKPKGVMIEHQALANLFAGMTQEIPFSAGDSILTLTSISFDIFVLESLIPLAAGMTLVAPAQERERDLRSLEQYIAEYPVKTIQLTPSRLRMLLDGQVLEPLRRASFLLIGGEPLPADLLQTLQATTAARIFNMYGPTETTVWSAVRELTDTADVAIGKPIANTRMYVLDRSDRVQPIGVIGELCIAGDGLARGYWNRPDLTNEKFPPDPYRDQGRMYRTGDLAKWLPDGNLAYMGRIDHQVKIRGYRIELGEIEAVMRLHDSIQEAVVIAREDENRPSFLCAYVVANEELTTAQYKEHAMLALPEYMVPSFFIRLDNIPLTPNGKIDRRALPEPQGNIHGGVEYVAPRNEIEAKLVEIWSEILELETIGVHDDFFDLGGNSIQLVRLHMALEREELLPERDTSLSFQHRTIEALASYIVNQPVRSVEEVGVVE